MPNTLKRSRRLKRSVALLCLLLIGSPAVLAQTVQLTVPLDQDNTVYEEGDLSNGIGEHLFAGRIASAAGPGARRRALLQFSPPALPPGAVLIDAELTLTVTRNATALPNAFTLHRVTSSWGEGTSDAGDPGGMGVAATTNDATWQHRFFNTQNWTTPGGDFVATASASTDVMGMAAYTWRDSGMVQDVRDWIDNPASNFGWLLMVDEAAGNRTARRFASSENAATADRPALTITYRLPDPTAVPVNQPWALLLQILLFATVFVLVIRRVHADRR